MSKEYISLKIDIKKEKESDLIISLLEDSGWKVEYQCTEQDNPKFIHTELVRKGETK